MKFYPAELTMRPFNYAVVDEVDNSLIDEARTPLIISGAAEDSADSYAKVDAVLTNLVEADYEIDEKHRSIPLTEAGNEHIEQLLDSAGLLHTSNLYDLQNIALVHHVNNALKDDEVYRTMQEKYEAIIRLIRDCSARKQPVLVGTVSIKKSELLSFLLKKADIPHNVLNARYHDVEAQIIADAGKPGAVTIATNMAGRGTDIKLGGNLEVRLAKELLGVENPGLQKEIQTKVEKQIAEDFEIVKKSGGLYVIGTERHESRRIDNQLRGRSGRQGDPGASKFFLSLEDDLMRIFGTEEALWRNTAISGS
jgi:preprotein translocase subunit SecA